MHLVSAPLQCAACGFHRHSASGAQRYKAFIVAVGLDIEGNEQVLGFWQERLKTLKFSDELANRGLRLNWQLFFVIDGAKPPEKLCSVGLDRGC